MPPPFCFLISPRLPLHFPLPTGSEREICNQNSPRHPPLSTSGRGERSRNFHLPSSHRVNLPRQWQLGGRPGLVFGLNPVAGGGIQGRGYFGVCGTLLEGRQKLSVCIRRQQAGAGILSPPHPYPLTHPLHISTLHTLPIHCCTTLISRSDQW